MPKASTNCWTCKRGLTNETGPVRTDFVVERKVGCDRTLPACLKCKRGQRDCQGYGLRLAWPDKQDGRRKQKRYEVIDKDIVSRYVRRNDGNLAFLNTVVADLDGSRLCVQDLIKGELITVMSNAVPMPRSLFPVSEQDGMLLNHCTFYERSLYRTSRTDLDQMTWR